MEGEAEGIREGVPDAVHRLRTRGLSVYYPTHSWPDSASVVDGVRRDRAWRDSGGESHVSEYLFEHCSSTPSQAIAIKLFGALPHSMGDERTTSAVTMINTAQRNRQKVNVVMALAQVRAFYYAQKKPRVCTDSLTLAPVSSLIPATTASEKCPPQPDRQILQPRAAASSHRQ
jgi:hypothetical protein